MDRKPVRYSRPPFSPSLLDPVWLRFVRELMWRNGLVGLSLYLLLTDNQWRNLRLNAVAYTVVVVWCYYDGALARGRWRSSLLEGFGWYFIAIQTTTLLTLVFGSPLTP